VRFNPVLNTSIVSRRILPPDRLVLIQQDAL
jgi:hypothetical protein